jgi:hypothetical protein
MDTYMKSPPRRLLIGAITAALAAALGLALVSFGPTHSGAQVHEMTSAGSANKRSAELRLHDKMRKLWEEHVAWTRLAIISFASDNPDLPPTLDRLLENQEDIGDAIKPYYGREAGHRLTKLLKDHINGAVEVLVAAKGGNQHQFARAKAAWYRNARQIADFLHRLNPRNWGRHEMREMMRTHLDQTLTEAADRLAGHYRADIRDYEAIERHILNMADTLSSGIVAQFPGRFS